MPFFSCHLINVCVSVGFQMWLSQLVMVALCYFNSSATFVKAAVRAVKWRRFCETSYLLF